MIESSTSIASSSLVSLGVCFIVMGLVSFPLPSSASVTGIIAGSSRRGWRHLVDCVVGGRLYNALVVFFVHL